MGIAIKEIHIRKLGPLNDFSMELGKLNLIYGPNERGKTYLVEFIIRSLFRTSSYWRLREERGSGRVVLEMKEGETASFSPDSKQKLDDLMDDMPGLPPDLSRLIVVRGAETGFADSDRKVDRKVLHHYLSGKGLLDQIENRISKTVQSTVVEKGSLSGPSKGEIRNRAAARDLINRLDGLFDRIGNEYSGGKREILSERKRVLEEDLEGLNRAKRFQAWRLHLELEALKQDMSRIPEAGLRETGNHLSLLNTKKEEFRKKSGELETIRDSVRHYDWLKEAVVEAEKWVERRPAGRVPLLLIPAGILLAGTAVLVLLGMASGALLSLAGAAVLIVLAIAGMRRRAAEAGTAREMGRLEDHYRERFGVPFDLADMKARLSRMEADRAQLQLIQKQLAEEEEGIGRLKALVGGWIERMTGERKDPDEWPGILGALERERASQMEKEKELVERLAALGVDPSDYLTDDPGVPYRRERFDEVQRKFLDTEIRLKEEENKLTALKQAICQYTQDIISTGWEELIDHLRTKREEAAASYRDITAEILGKRLVYGLLEELRSEENAKIEENLRSGTVLAALPRITGRYSRLRLEGDDLVVSDETHDFPFSVLSTGAQEQVLLALRMGLLQRAMKRNPLFLILDDAFQYSDWKRRQLLVDHVADLARSGWQILYLTMDDHLRDCFHKQSKSMGKHFREHQLQKG